jgi:hypothetical protein
MSKLKQMITVTQSTYNSIKAMLNKGRSVELINDKTRTSVATIQAIKEDRVEILPTRSVRKEEPSDVFFRH